MSQGRLRLKCDGTRAKTRFRLSEKRTSTFKSAWASVQSTAGSRVVRISGSNAGYTMFRGSVKGTSYPLHSPVPSSHPHPCITVCHHILTGLYTSTHFIYLHIGDTGNCECRQLTKVLFALSSVLNVDCEMLVWRKKNPFTLVVRQGISKRRGQLTYAVLCLWRFLTDLVNGSVQMTLS